MTRKALSAAAAAAWFLAYAVLAFRSEWGVLPFLALGIGVVILRDQITAAARCVGRFLENAFDFAYVVVHEFSHEAPAKAEPTSVEAAPLTADDRSKRAA